MEGGFYEVPRCKMCRHYIEKMLQDPETGRLYHVVGCWLKRDYTYADHGWKPESTDCFETEERRVLREITHLEEILVGVQEHKQNLERKIADLKKLLPLVN